MRKEAKDKHFIKQPVYEGGPSAMKKFIGENLQYPPQALEAQIEGTVYVKYDIDFQGRVTEAKVITGLGHGCDEEAIRLVKMLRFNVAKNRGVRVVYHQHIQIHFRLPKTKALVAENSFQYTIVPSSPKKAQQPKTPAGTGHSYTVSF